MTDVNIEEAAHYNGVMDSDTVSSIIEEQAPLVIHAVVSCISSDDQSFGGIYEGSATLPRALNGQMDVESAVEILHKLYHIVWPASREETEAGTYVVASRWIRLFEEEEDWLGLLAHVRFMEKQLWKWKYHGVKALFDAWVMIVTR